MAKCVPGALCCPITVSYECSILGGQADYKSRDIFGLKTVTVTVSHTYAKSPHIFKLKIFTALKISRLPFLETIRVLGKKPCLNPPNY